MGSSSVFLHHFSISISKSLNQVALKVAYGYGSRFRVSEFRGKPLKNMQFPDNMFDLTRSEILPIFVAGPNISRTAHPSDKRTTPFDPECKN